jgi:hypothetical protein
VKTGQLADPGALNVGTAITVDDLGGGSRKMAAIVPSPLGHQSWADNHVTKPQTNQKNRAGVKGPNRLTPPPSPPLVESLTGGQNDLHRDTVHDEGEDHIFSSPSGMHDTSISTSSKLCDVLFCLNELTP